MRPLVENSVREAASRELRSVQEALLASLPAIVEANFERAMERYRVQSAGSPGPWAPSVQRSGSTPINPSEPQLGAPNAPVSGMLDFCTVGDTQPWFPLPAAPQQSLQVEDSGWEDLDWAISEDFLGQK